MSRGRAVGVLVAAFLMTTSATAFAWSFGKTKTADTKAATAVSTPSNTEPVVAQTPAPAPEPAKVVAPAQPTVSKAQMDKQRVMRERKRVELNNTEWDITVSALSGKGAAQNDVLTFVDSKFSSQAYSGMGFGASNYTLTVVEDGSAVAETMQSSEKEGMVFWRIELDPAMATAKGIISRQIAPNKTEDYSFSSTAKRPIVKAAPVAEKAPAATK
jgi:hypothetical protein